MNNILFYSIFALCALFELLVPLFAPALKLTFFAPIIAIALYRKKTIEMLYVCLIAGFVMDLLSSSPFGYWSSTYLIAALFLTYIKPFFFADKLWTMPIISIIFAQVTTLTYTLTTHLFLKKFAFNAPWFFTDLAILPFADGIYAFIAFQWPLKILIKWIPQKKRSSKTFRLVKD